MGITYQRSNKRMYIQLAAANTVQFYRCQKRLLVGFANQDDSGYQFMITVTLFLPKWNPMDVADPLNRGPFCSLRTKRWIQNQDNS